MIIGALHWFLATGIAVSIHLAGMMWLSLGEPVRQIEPERASYGIVVNLGRDAGASGEAADSVAPDQGEAVTDAETLEAEQADTTARTSPAPETDTAPAPEADDPEPNQAAPQPATEPEEPRTAPATAGVEPDTAEIRSVQPQAVESRQATDAGSPEPEPEAVTVESVPDAEPTPSRPVESQETARVEVVQTERARPTVETPAEPGESVPVEFAETATVPETPEPAAPARDTAAPDVSAASPAQQPTADVARAESAPDPASEVESVPTLQSTDSASTMQLQPVEASASGEDPEVTAAAQPAPEVKQTSQPETSTTAVPQTSKAAVPETVDLQELRESEGEGSGVVARYAGVIKGWIQKNMHYPRAARLAGQEGEVVVRFIMDRDGRVQSVELESGSGFPLLDREATEMIERGNPFPAMPVEMPGQKLEVRVPVSFHVEDETQTREIPPIYLD